MRSIIVVVFLLFAVSACADSYQSGGESYGVYVNTGVNLQALGNDVVADESWDPAVDFSDASLYYFYPAAEAGGDGTLGKPFRGLGVELLAGDKIQRFNESNVLQNPGAIIEPGDVCVLLGGDHGDIALDSYYGRDWLGIVGQDGASVSAESIDWYRSNYIYAENLTINPKLRSEFSTTGSQHNDAPEFVRITGTSTVDAHHIILKNIKVASADSSVYLNWSTEDRRLHAPDGVFLQYLHHALLQNSSIKGMNHGVQLLDSSIAIIHGSEVDGISGDGIMSSGDSLTIRNNDLSNFFDVTNGTTFTNHNDIIQCYGSALLSKITVDGNYIIRQTGLNDDETGQLNGLLMSTSGSWEDVKLINNVVLGGGEMVLRIHGPIDGGIISNNTGLPIYDASESGDHSGPLVTLDGPATNCFITNNILRKNYGSASTGITESNNTYYGNNNPNIYGFVSYDWDTSPLGFNLALSELSSQRNVGALDGAPDHDILGFARPQGLYLDRGAYEYIILDKSAPAQLAGFTASSSRDTIDFDWNDTAESDWDHYEIYRGVTAESLSLFKVLDNHSDSDWKYTGATLDSTYHWSVAVVDSTALLSELVSARSVTPTMPFYKVAYTTNSAFDDSLVSVGGRYNEVLSGDDHKLVAGYEGGNDSYHGKTSGEFVIRASASSYFGDVSDDRDMFWVNTDTLPSFDGSTVTRAILRIQYNNYSGGVTFSATDTLTFLAMTNPDILWPASRTNFNTSDSNMNDLATTKWPAKDGVVKISEYTERISVAESGEPFVWSYLTDFTVGQEAWVEIDLIDIFQAFADGAANNGILIGAKGAVQWVSSGFDRSTDSRRGSLILEYSNEEQ